MLKVDDTVRRESIYVAIWVVILSVLMQAVFVALGKWNYTVLCGNLLGGAAAVANFFLLGLTVQKAIKLDKKEIANAVKLSQSGRMLMLIVIALLGALLPCFDVIATIIPLLFGRIAIAFRPMVDKFKEKA